MEPGVLVSFRLPCGRASVILRIVQFSARVRGSVLKLRDGRVKAPDGLEYQSGILLVFVKLRRRDEAFT